MGQPIRLSQFILTYGVGSILESVKGPRLIPAIGYWDSTGIKIFSEGGERIRIIDNENIRSQLDGNEVFQLPSNIEYDVHTSKSLFKTFRFPSWALCEYHTVLYKLRDNGGSNCPSCISKIGDFQGEAIRFIRACPKGHLDDVDWIYTVHKGASCSGNTFEWREMGGSDLKNIELTCSSCKRSAKLADIYNIPQICSGYFPEDRIREDCTEYSSVILRNASSLRVAEIITAITIPEIKTSIHLLIGEKIGRSLCEFASGSPNPKNTLLNFVRESGKIDQRVIEEIERFPDEEVNYAVRKIGRDNQAKSASEVKMEEYYYLKTAASDGYHEPGIDIPKFEVDRTAVGIFSHKNGLEFRVTPIKRLTIVMAQKGYRRPVRGPKYKKGEDEERSVDLVHTFFQKEQKRWYPGIELHGEGIFIDLPKGGPVFDPHISLQKNYAADPLYVWWHSLAHRLIIGLSLDSGYSSTSIRERIYFEPRRIENGKVIRSNGGVLLYTSQYGGDGTLGGLIALAGQEEIPNVFAAAEKNLHTCSNDPLCSSNYSYSNGAACYACLLISETSCETYNINLDRNILINGLSKKT